jgi:hypothetical protein
MENQPLPRSVHQAGQVLLTTLIQQAREHDEVRRALKDIVDFVGAEAGQGSNGNGRLQQKLVTPGPDRRVVPVRDGQPPRREPDDDSLKLVRKRASWKADACRWAVERRELAKDADGNAKAISKRDEELRSAREPLEDCFAWMLDPYRRLPGDKRMQQIAACYDNLALAADCTLKLVEAGGLEPTPPADVLYPIAECQSALLSALEAAELRGDSDQRDLFDWLKAQTLRHRIYVDRHMKLDDPADFTGSEGLAARMRSVTQEILDRQQSHRQHDKLLSKLRYHLEKWVETDGTSQHDLDSIELVMGEWLKKGYSLTDGELRSVLSSIAEHLPDGRDLPECVQRAIEASGASNGSSNGRKKPQMVLRATELLRDRAVALYAGAPRPQPKQALEGTLELRELHWTEYKSEQAIESLEEHLDAGVDLILVALRLSPTLTQTFKDRCAAAEVPLVWLPSGYGPGQVAHQVVRQVGAQLQPL